MITVISIGLLASAQGTPSLAMRESLRLNLVKAPPSVERYGLAEFEVEAKGTYDDPFDAEQIRLDATFVGPDGKTVSLPGFYDGGDASVGLWRVRFAPTQTGNYFVRLNLTDKSGTLTRETALKATASTARGFIGIDDRDHRFFAFSDGTPFWPLGFPTANYKPEAVRETGANSLKWSLAGPKSEFNLTPGGRGRPFIDLAASRKLDEALAKAAQNGVYALLTLDSFESLRFEGTDAGWSTSPWNEEAGGPLRSWRDFWTSDIAEKWYRNKLRYLAARYAAYPSLLGWEFWNDVDRVSDYDPQVVRDWHQRQGKLLAGFDPYHHLQTTSLADTKGNRTLDLIPELDFIQTHTVGSADPAGIVAAQQSRKSGWGKPHFVGRVSATPSDPFKLDSDAVQVRDALWTSMATGSTGGAFSAWDVTENSAAQSAYAMVSRFVKDIDWGDEGFRQSDVGLAFADPKRKPANGDLVLEDGPVAGPQSIAIANGKLLGSVPSSILRGYRPKDGPLNPLNARIRVTQTTTLEVSVGPVLGDIGARVRVVLDGNAVMNKEFSGAEPHGTFPITLTPGLHQLQIENTGADHVRVGYRLKSVVPRTTPRLDAWGLVGDRHALVWMRQAGRTWRAAVEQKRAFPTVTGAVFGLRGLHSGTWKVEFWDTKTGQVASTSTARVGIDGRFRTPLPSIDRDLAIKLIRETP